MKRILSLLLTITLACSLGACAASAGSARVMTSFYPIYIFALNVFDGIKDIDVECMTAPQTGCLHDYQLLASDMMKLSEADALIVCGAGMESYLPDVQAQFPSLPVIDCSNQIDLLALDADGHAHEHEESAVYNAHTWLDAQNAIRIVCTIAEQAALLFPQDAAQIDANAGAYIERLQQLDADLKSELEPLKGKKIVTFHEAFPYFARAYGLEIAAVITEDHEEAIAPSRIAEVIEQVNAAGVPPLFIEPQYASKAAYTIAAETGASVYMLDPLSSGIIDLRSYESGMRGNAQTLLSAFADEIPAKAAQ